MNLAEVRSAKGLPALAGYPGVQWAWQKDANHSGKGLDHRGVTPSERAARGEGEYWWEKKGAIERPAEPDERLAPGGV
jgi:hypothetical protein